MYVESSTLVFTLVALDQGTPPRGDTAQVRITLSNTCLLTVLFDAIDISVLVDLELGNVTLRIPKYYIRNYGEYVNNLFAHDNVQPFTYFEFPYCNSKHILSKSNCTSLQSHMIRPFIMYAYRTFKPISQNASE